MTFDIGVWKSSSSLSSVSASFIYNALCRGESSSQLKSAAEAITLFYEELTNTLPEGGSGSPWSARPLRAENYVLLSCVWEHAEIVLSFVVALAGRHGLVVFEPQSEEVYLADAAID